VQIARERKTTMFIYVFNLKGTDFYKVGFTSNVRSRQTSIQTSQPFDVNLIFSFKHIRAKECEVVLHTFLQHYHVRGEWFSIKDRSVLTYACNWFRDNQEYDTPMNLWLTFIDTLPAQDKRVKYNTKLITAFMKNELRRTGK
jgi:hypothetical protein